MTRGKGSIPARAGRVASIERTMERVSLDARENENIARRVRTAGETRAGAGASVRGGAVRRARVSSARDAPWLPIRVARGSARARASHGLRRARARRKSTPAPRRARASRTASPSRFGWWFPACGRAPAAPATPLRPLRRVRVRGASASGRSRARPARRHGRACGPPDAHRYCRRFPPRGALSGSALALRGGQTRTESAHVSESKTPVSISSQIRSGVQVFSAACDTKGALAIWRCNVSGSSPRSETKVDDFSTRSISPMTDDSPAVNRRADAPSWNQTPWPQSRSAHPALVRPSSFY